MGKRSNSLNEITFVGILGMTTSLRADRLRDERFSPPIANGEVEERQVDSDTGQPHAAVGRMPQRSGLSRSPRRTSGTEKAFFASNVDAMLLDLEGAAPGDTFPYPENS